MAKLSRRLAQNLVGRDYDFMGVARYRTGIHSHFAHMAEECIQPVYETPLQKHGGVQRQ